MRKRHQTKMERYLPMLLLVAFGGLAVTCVQRLTKNDQGNNHDAAAVLQQVEHAFMPAPAFAVTEPGGSRVVIADIAEAAVPSVVNIWATKTVASPRDMGPFSRDPFFRDFFGPHFFDRIPRERKQRSLGSGVVVSSDGVILTNSHVVENADDLRITLTDGRDYKAKVLGSDARSDIAVLRLEGKVEGLKALKLGDSSAMRLGDVVIAIGNPFGVGQTVTMGIVSALGRGNVGIVDYEDFIQTDAAINPGNSGGALVNMRGELIGLNTAILSRSGGYQGVGFAIPSNLAEPTMEVLRKKGKIVRGWLGVTIQDLNRELAKGFGLDIHQGVLISDVSKNGPADKAGLKRGDVIVSFGKEPIYSTSKLRNRIALAGPKARVRLGVSRAGKNRSFVVSLGELSERDGKTDVDQDAESSAKDSPLGLTLSRLNEASRQKHGVPDGIREGLVITELDPHGMGARAGLRVGDVIVELNRQPVKSVQDFSVRAGKKGTILLLVQRKGATMYVAISR